MHEKSRWELYKEKNGVTLIDLFSIHKEEADPGLIANRYETCLSCSNFISLTKQCIKCGCFMMSKTRFLKAKCPEGKW